MRRFITSSRFSQRSYTKKARTYATATTGVQSSSSSNVMKVAALATFGGLSLWLTTAAADEKKVDLAQIRAEIVETLSDPLWDDGSWGPVLMRLCWHNSGTYSTKSGDGGSDGANIRFSPEKDYGANAGLHHAMARLEDIKKRHPEISYADLYTFAGYVALEEMDGPAVPFRLGRSDSPDNSNCTEDGRLPDATQGGSHLRDIFYRMGFNDKEIVALSGAHALGRCHTDRSGFDGPWTKSPTYFSNDYYVQLLEQKWVPKDMGGATQFVDAATGTLMMLPTDVALLEDASFKKYVQMYAADEDLFKKDFASAFRKLTENGVNFPNTMWCC